MKCTERDVRMSPLSVAIAVIVFLTATTVLAAAFTRSQNQPRQFDRPGSPASTYLVHRLTGEDILEPPNVRPDSVNRPHSAIEDAYYLHRVDLDAAGPARLEGILMDDPRLFAAICRTV